MNATENDIVACYHILLGRDPDEAGLRNWKVLAAKGVPLTDIVQGFKGSPEYSAKQKSDSQFRAETNGYVIYLDPRWADGVNLISGGGTYEPHVTKELRRILSPESVFVDIGANVGLFTLMAASILTKGKVFALEPAHENLQLLYRSVTENKFTNVTIYPYAATDRQKILRFGSWGPYCHVASDADSDYVAGVALDELLPYQRIDVVKMDIEGHEPFALKGMERIIKQWSPTIFTEFNPSCLRDFAKVNPLDYLSALRGYGYQLHILQPGNSPTAASEKAVMDCWHQVNKVTDTLPLELMATPL